MSKIDGMFLILGLFLMGALAGDANAQEKARPPVKLVSFPEALSKACRGGRAKIYDECQDQLLIYAAAAARAAAERKVLLISYGAEWCIWCHVFEAYVRGGKGKFTYTFGSPEAPEERDTATLFERQKTDVSGEAEALKRFAAENFVIAHIDAQHAPNGQAALEQTGADQHYNSSLPYIFTVGADGKFAAKFDHKLVENRRDTDDWYRGYHRAKLLKMLTDMRDAARREGSHDRGR